MSSGSQFMRYGVGLMRALLDLIAGRGAAGKSAPPTQGSSAPWTLECEPFATGPWLHFDASTLERGWFNRWHFAGDELLLEYQDYANDKTHLTRLGETSFKESFTLANGSGYGELSVDGDTWLLLEIDTLRGGVIACLLDPKTLQARQAIDVPLDPVAKTSIGLSACALATLPDGRIVIAVIIDPESIGDDGGIYARMEDGSVVEVRPPGEPLNDENDKYCWLNVLDPATGTVTPPVRTVGSNGIAEAVLYCEFDPGVPANDLTLLFVASVKGADSPRACRVDWETGTVAALEGVAPLPRWWVDARINDQLSVTTALPLAFKGFLVQLASSMTARPIWIHREIAETGPSAGKKVTPASFSSRHERKRANAAPAPPGWTLQATDTLLELAYYAGTVLTIRDDHGALVSTLLPEEVLRVMSPGATDEVELYATTHDGPSLFVQLVRPLPILPPGLQATGLVRFGLIDPPSQDIKWLGYTALPMGIQGPEEYLFQELYNTPSGWLLGLSQHKRVDKDSHSRCWWVRIDHPTKWHDTIPREMSSIAPWLDRIRAASEKTT